MKKNSTDDMVTFHDIILSGGPPWGFTLTGGSEFGSMLRVSKVTNEQKAVYGSLHTGDHILSVNGISCTSRSSAIQMVRTIDDELRLKVCRRNNGRRKGDVSLEEETFPLDTTYVVVDEMNEVCKGLKASGVNEWNYKIISINKDEKTNQHSIRIGIDDTILARHNENNCENVGRQPGRISERLTPVAQQQLTVKMMPSIQGGPRITKCAARTYSTDDSQLVCPNVQERDDNVEAEPCKRVSTARAMFENMSSASHHFKTKSQSKQQLKSWNSSSLLDNCENDKSSTVLKSTKSFHEHSKSLPLDISAQSTCKQPSNFSTASITISSNKSNVDNDRPKSAFMYDGKKRGIARDIETPSVHTASHSEIITCTNLEEQMSTIASYSSEDLRHYGKDNVDARGKLPSNSASKNHSANELRQAASKYHQELMKNYPKFRSAITGKDNAHKFTARKVSVPTEEPFARGETTRATIATSTVARMPRSYSTNDTIQIQDLSEVLSKTSENSMMSRLLRDQGNPATLVKIDEEIKLASATVGKSVKVVIQRNSLDESHQTSDTYTNVDNRQRTASLNAMGSIGMGSIGTPNQQQNTEKHVFVERPHRYTGSKSTGSILPEMKSISVQTEAMLKNKESERSTCRRTSSESSQNGDVKMKQATLSDCYPTRKDDINTAIHKSIQHTLSPHSNIDLKHSTNNNNNNNNNKDINNSDDINANNEAIASSVPLRSPLYTHTETDIDGDDSSEIARRKDASIDVDDSSEIVRRKDASIDGDDACDIIHQKDASTDSAVYVLDEQISHVKALSNESTDSVQQYSDLTYKHYNDGGYLPTSPDDILNYPYHGDDVNEKEKPQRTINRRKKDSTLSSRNNSCVSTDSTASTATVDSGIVVRSDLTQQAGYNKDLNGSRETLDDDVAALSDESLLMSTPERNEEAKNAGYQLLGKSYGSLSNQSPSSSGEHSRRDSLQSPRTADLDDEKAKLVGSMREKISELRDQEQEIADEIKMNEELGKKVLTMVKCKATHNEFTKFELFIGELNKIVKLLLSLTQRLHRYELMLQDLDMSNEADKAKKDGLISKIDKLKSQHEEACYLRDVNDKRGDAVASFLEKYCTEEEFADFQYYVDMKSQLALMQSEIREKVKLGEERLKALELTTSEWYK